MSGNVNKVILIGNVGTKPELKPLPNGNVVNFRLATKERGSKEERSGGQDERDDKNTQWHSIVAYNRQAELLSQYVKVGDRVYLEGRLRYRTYEKDGQTRYVTEIIVSDVTFLGGPNKDEGDHPAAESSHRSPPATARPTSSRAPAPAPAYQQDDDEIPF